jgi:hypothetical protein
VHCGGKTLKYLITIDWDFLCTAPYHRLQTTCAAPPLVCLSWCWLCCHLFIDYWIAFLLHSHLWNSFLLKHEASFQNHCFSESWITNICVFRLSPSLVSFPLTCIFTSLHHHSSQLYCCRFSLLQKYSNHSIIIAGTIFIIIPCS